MFYDTVRRWKKKSDSGSESIEKAPNQEDQSLHLVTVIVSKVKETVDREARYTVRDIARTVGISLSRAHYILKNILNFRKISAGWVPPLLTDGQNKQS